MWLITRYTGYHGMYRYMRCTWWYILLQTHCWCDTFAVNFVKWYDHWPWHVGKYSLTLIWHCIFHALDLYMMRFKRERSKSSSSVVSLSYEVIWMQQPSRLSGGKSPPHPSCTTPTPPPHIYSLPYPDCSSPHPLKFYITF